MTSIDNELHAAAKRIKETLRDPWNYFDRGTFVPKRLSEELMVETTYTTPENLKETYFFDKECGYYRLAEAYLRNKSTIILGDLTTPQRINATVTYIKDITYTPNERQEPPLELINLKNGVYNIKTKELTKHTPKHFFLGVLPVAYNPESKCPTIKRFLREITENEKDALGLEEFAGYCLYRDMPVHEAFMLLGDGRNGKSTYIRLLRSLLGKDSLTNYSLQALTERPFLVIQLLGKLANTFADLPSKGINNTGIFKALTGNDEITGEKKFVQGGINFTSYAKLIFSCNQIPKNDDDDTDGYWSRWLTLRFPHQFPADSDKCKPKILEEELLPELEGFLNLALIGLNRLKNNNWRFSNDETIKMKREKQIKSSDPLKYFVETRVEETNSLNDRIFKEDFYSEYVLFVQEQKLRTPKTIGVVSKELRRLLPNITDMKAGNKTVWVGIKIKPKKEQNRQIQGLAGVPKDISGVEGISGINPFFYIITQNHSKEENNPDTPDTPDMAQYHNGIGNNHLTETIKVFFRRNKGEVKIEELLNFMELAGHPKNKVDEQISLLIKNGGILKHRAGYFKATEEYLGGVGEDKQSN